MNEWMKRYTWEFPHIQRNRERAREREREREMFLVGFGSIHFWKSCATFIRSVTEIPRENERFAATSIPIPFEDLKQTGLKVDIAEMSTFSPVGSLSSNGMRMCPYLSTHTVYQYKIQVFHYFGGIWPYWKMNTRKQNFREILLLF